MLYGKYASRTYRKDIKFKILDQKFETKAIIHRGNALIFVKSEKQF